MHARRLLVLAFWLLACGGDPHWDDAIESARKPQAVLQARDAEFRDAEFGPSADKRTFFPA